MSWNRAKNIYLMELRVLDTDPNRVVLKSLKNICAGEDLIFAAPDAMIYHFSDCSN
ncbi:MAG: hypothetical protein UT61_C0043G0005 [Candidatus Woesebacteria bacterium GW2011_GWA1_39_8]|uniref:Uncharacterized protein n=1 Tax=Candidatus Woesebacteria bacterium GW2011_GWA1_39_8 TaxID=1618552 RepID=A0A0G0ST36_9BACT|nr:MAG: hypothetical protein UT61_C0043G0005 [Candidatus Woesebacteria bacterium GW2011_GWA1_39_8]